MIAAASSDGSSCGQLDDFFGRPSGEEGGRSLGTHLAERFHRQAAVALDEQGKRRLPVFVRQIGKDLGEIGRVLLVQQVDEVRRRAYAEQAFHGVQYDVELALRHGRASGDKENCSM